MSHVSEARPHGDVHCHYIGYDLVDRSRVWWWWVVVVVVVVVVVGGGVGGCSQVGGIVVVGVLGAGYRRCGRGGGGGTRAQKQRIGYTL